MKHIWTVLCQNTSIDVESNLLSLFNCVEEMALSIDKTKVGDGKLVVPVKLQLVSFWTINGSNQAHVLNVEGELIDPKGQILNKFNNIFNIKKEVKRFRNRTNIDGLPVTEPGEYTFRIKYKPENESKYQVVAEIPLNINISYKLMDLKKAKE